MKQTWLLPMLLVSAAAFAAPIDSWYTGFPKGMEASPSKQELPSSHFFEIPVSQFANAEQLLSSKSVVHIQNRYFGAFPQCPASTTPYLVRAVYERTNNVFFVYIVGSNILVLGNALGPPEPQHRSALVVCLTVQPTSVYTATGGAL